MENRIQDWIVEAPDTGFLFPAFNERNSDIHELLYYAKNPEILQVDLIDQFLRCRTPPLRQNAEGDLPDSDRRNTG